MATRDHTARRPNPRDRRSAKSHFSPEMWFRWMAERTDRRTARLRAGIAAFRRQLEVRS